MAKPIADLAPQDHVAQPPGEFLVLAAQWLRQSAAEASKERAVALGRTEPPPLSWLPSSAARSLEISRGKT